MDKCCSICLHLKFHDWYAAWQISCTLWLTSSPSFQDRCATKVTLSAVAHHYILFTDLWLLTFFFHRTSGLFFWSPSGNFVKQSVCSFFKNTAGVFIYQEKNFCFMVCWNFFSAIHFLISLIVFLNCWVTNTTFFCPFTAKTWSHC